MPVKTKKEELTQADRDIANLRADICRRDFSRFVKKFWSCVPGAGNMVWNWHMQVFCEELQKVAERVFNGEQKEYDLICNVSPGTSKSTLWSILFPAWVWTRMPEARILTASHTQNLSLDLSGKARIVIQSKLYQETFPGIEFVKDSEGYYTNTKGGDRLACTVGGKTPTGFHAAFLIIDDPLDPQKALSQAELQNACDFMTTVLPTRKVDKEISVTCLIMQRLHAQDPTGALLEVSRKTGGTPIKHICLPAELIKTEDGEWDAKSVSPPELVGHYVDGLMDPLRLGRTILQGFRTTLGEYAYQGQFLQKPIPPGGQMFHCLVPGTMVTTTNGQVPIEKVLEGDLVLTREGFKKVAWSGMTKVANKITMVGFSNDTYVAGTPEHLVFVQNKGFVRLDSLRFRERVVAIEEALSWKSSLKGKHGQTNISKNTSALVGVVDSSTSSPTTKKEAFLNIFMGIIKDQREASSLCLMGSSSLERKEVFTSSVLQQDRCTDMCGNTTTEPSPTVTMSITKTGTQVIITYQTWSAYPHQTTLSFTQDKEGVWQVNTQGKDSLSGISLLQVEKCIVNELKNTGQTEKLAEKLASCVVRLFGPKPTKKPSSALGLAETKTTTEEPTRKKEPDGVPVFDLTVQDAHEFFANGILVHNCEYFSLREKAAPMDSIRIRYWDRASTDMGGCNTAGVLIAKSKDGRFFVEHVVAGQWEPDERNKKIKAVALRDRTKYGPKYAPKIYIEREGGSSGRDAWKAIARVLEGFPVYEDTVSGDKETRAEGWSCQLASNNVWLVEDGTWEINAYIEEHVLFPLGKFKDRVDASTGAFNLLAGAKNISKMFKVFSIADRKQAQLHIMALTHEELGEHFSNDKALWVNINDPLDDFLPTHGLNLLDYFSFPCADIDNKDYQDRWNEVVEPWGKVPSDLLMTREHGKRIWSFLLKKREPSPKLLVFSSAKERQCLSVACAVCDALGLPRSVIFRPKDETVYSQKPDNEHVYDLVKSCRGLVVS